MQRDVSTAHLFCYVAPLQQAAREVVRELRRLERAPAGVTHTQCHALVELERAGTATASDLAERLQVDKSSMSRALADLARRRLVAVRRDPVDARRRRISLTAAGGKLLSRIQAAADARVQGALALLSPEDRARVASGVALYARVLLRARVLAEHAVRPIGPRDDAAIARIIRDVLAEHGAVGPGYASADEEVSHMSAAYRAEVDPPARYYVIERGGAIVGGGGFAALAAGAPGTCELRKMYLLPSARGSGLGRQLLYRCLRAARDAGYGRCYLETLTTMGRARALYESVGFARLDAPEGATGHDGCNTFYALSLAGASCLGAPIESKASTERAAPRGS